MLSHRTGTMASASSRGARLAPHRQLRSRQPPHRSRSPRHQIQRIRPLRPLPLQGPPSRTPSHRHELPLGRGRAIAPSYRPCSLPRCRRNTQARGRCFGPRRTSCIGHVSRCARRLQSFELGDGLGRRAAGHGLVRSVRKERDHVSGQAASSTSACRRQARRSV